MSWMNRLCSRWLRTLDEIMSWLSSSQEKIIMCWWYRRRAWSKGCIMSWCVSSSRRWDDHGLIIKLSEECIICWCMWRSQGDDHVLIIKSKRRSIMGWWRAREDCIMCWCISRLGMKMSSCVDGHQVKIPKWRQSSCVDDYEVKNPDLKQGCASSSFKWCARQRYD